MYIILCFFELLKCTCNWINVVFKTGTMSHGMVYRLSLLTHQINLNVIFLYAHMLQIKCCANFTIFKIHVYL